MMLMIGFMTLQIMDIKKVATFITMFVMIQLVYRNIFAMQTQCQQFQIVQVIS